MDKIIQISVLLNHLRLFDAANNLIALSIYEFCQPNVSCTSSVRYGPLNINIDGYNLRPAYPNRMPSSGNIYIRAFYSYR